MAFLFGVASEEFRAAIAVGAVALVLACAARNVPVALRIGLLLAMLIGIVDADVIGSHEPRQPDGHIRREAVTVTDAHPSGDGLVTTTLRFADGTLGSVELREPPEAIGARLLVRGKRVLFDGVRNPGEPAARDLAAERGLTWRFVRASVLARRPPDDRDVALYCARVRAWASARVHETFPEPEATILAGAMWGERGNLAPDLREEFQNTGTVHVLVTAGLHLGVVAALAVAALEFFGCGRISASLAAIAIVWLYAALSGDHLPSVRAATMLTFARATRRACRKEPMKPAPPVTIIIGAGLYWHSAPRRAGRSRRATMTDRPKFFDDLAGVAGGAFSALTGLRDEAQASARSAMEEAMRKLDLVRRSDLDAVQELAANARAGQEAAEARLAALEARMAAMEAAGAAPTPHVPATSHPDVEEDGAAQPPPREPLDL